MAVLGHSELEAVNQMLAARALGAVAAISGNDEAERCQTVLQHWTRIIQTQGHKENMRRKKYTAATPVTVGSDVLRLQCVAPGRYADNVVLNGDALHCLSEDTNAIAEDVHCLIWVELSFEASPPTLKDKILAAATQDYLARVMQRPELPQVLEKQALIADLGADRATVDAHATPPSVPSIRSVSGGGGGS